MSYLRTTSICRRATLFERSQFALAITHFLHRYKQTPLNKLNNGCAIFFEFRHYKPEKKKVVKKLHVNLLLYFLNVRL